MRRLLLTIPAAACCIAGCGSKRSADVEFTSRELNLKVRLPKEWSVRKSQLVRGRLLVSIPGESMKQAYIHMVRNQTPPGIGVARLMSLSSKMWAERFPGARVEPVRQIMVNGKLMHVEMVHYDLWGKKCTQKMVRYFMGKWSYALTYMATEDRFPKYLKAFDNMVESFSPLSAHQSVK